MYHPNTVSEDQFLGFSDDLPENFSDENISLSFRRNYTSKTFILPVMIFTLVYNLPKFFELYVKKDIMIKSVNCTDIIEDPAYSEYKENCTENLAEMINVTVLDQNDQPQYKISIGATDMRINRIYIRVYIIWLNLIVLVIVPFVLLIVLNILTYKKIVEFEQNLSNQMREQNARSSRRVTKRERVTSDGNVDNAETIQLVSEHEEEEEEQKANLLQRIKSKQLNISVLFLMEIIKKRTYCSRQVFLSKSEWLLRYCIFLHFYDICVSLRKIICY